MLEVYDLIPGSRDVIKSYFKEAPDAGAIFSQSLQMNGVQLKAAKAVLEADKVNQDSALYQDNNPVIANAIIQKLDELIQKVQN